MWQFEICDNGMGIPKNLSTDVFLMFRRLEPQNYDGIGAGLCIAQKIVHAHGGDIWIETTLNEGTSVFFTLPMSED